MKRFAVLVCVVLAGCVSGTEGVQKAVSKNTLSPYARIPVSGALEQIVRQRFDNILKDPESLRFRGLRASSTRLKTGAQTTIVCGEYNAKNGFGGYTGYEPFAVEVVNGRTNGFVYQNLVASVCAVAGL